VKWTYITADYGCTRGCTSQARHGATLSWPYLCLALLASVAWGLRLAFSSPGLTWFRAAGVLAWGLLALLLAGSFLSLFFIATGPRSCQLCGAPMSLRGRHFTSALEPHWTDYALMAVFGSINLAAWIAIDIEPGLAGSAAPRHGLPNTS